MKDDKCLQVQKDEGNDKSGQRQPENPSQQVRDFKGVQNRKTENAEIEGQADGRQRNAENFGVRAGQNLVTAARHGTWHVNTPHDGQVQGIDHSQKGDDANRRRALFHFAAWGVESIIAAKSSTPLGNGFRA